MFRYGLSLGGGTPMIKVMNLSKIYSNGKGIFDLSFEVKKGEVFGYLGPNGSGKTTTIRNLLGFTNPTKGGCAINGLDCRKEAKDIQKILGYIPGEIAFMNDMSGTEFLKFMNQMRGTTDLSRCNELVSRLDLDTKGKIKKMSKGMKQKLGIVTAFMHDPEVYILDEPTSGLDPLMQKTFIELVKEEKAREKTFLMSSHMFDEVAKTCDRAGIIKDGRLVAIEDIHELKASQRRVFTVTLASREDVDMLRASGLLIESIASNTVHVIVEDDYDSFISALAKCRVMEIDVITADLEQIFMKYYRQEGK
jgi:ABC-2 type transport system ATP-binding protein